MQLCNGQGYRSTFLRAARRGELCVLEGQVALKPGAGTLGSYATFATLPPACPPNRRLIFSQCYENVLSRVDVAAGGRASGGPLGRKIRTLAAWTLLAGLQLHSIYTLSEWNVADVSSRGEPLPIPRRMRLLRRWQQARAQIDSWYRALAKRKRVAN